MNMELNIQITNLEIEIKPTVREDNIKAFVNLIFNSSQGDIKIKNGTLRLKSFGTKQMLSYEVPAVKTAHRYNKVFYLDNLELYKKICDAVIKEYSSVTGEVIGLEQEEVNIDEIPV